MEEELFELCDVCNLNRIYNKNFEYYLPKKALEELIFGNTFDHMGNYSREELKKIQEDARDIYRNTVLPSSPRKAYEMPKAIITAGASGAGKTTLLEGCLSQNILSLKDYIYICTDEVCLKNQKRTFLTDIKNSDKSLKVKQNIFNKWRPSSHAIKHLILGNVIREKRSFFLGTTCSESHTRQFFELLKKQGYYIKLLYVATPDKIRWQSVQERNKFIVHAFSDTEEGMNQHGLLLAQQVCAFPIYADEIEFYYRKGVKDSANLTALWTRNASNSKTLGTLYITSPQDYLELKKIHDSAAETLNRPDLLWDTLFDEKSELGKVSDVPRDKKATDYDVI